MNIFLLSVFVISASFGFICLFHAARVKSIMLQICSRDQSTIFQIAKIIAESPLYILTIRLGGVVAWIIAAASCVALMHRLANGIQ
jgi:hypothetical protein